MKKKGSALVFSVLMLSFFLAISLNIFFQARKKAERAGVKVQGERTTNNIDIASSLGYQELKLAEKFVSEGILYSATHPIITGSYGFHNEDYPPIDSSTYINELYVNLSSGVYDKKYAGIQLNNLIDYFSSQWDYDAGASADEKVRQKLIMGDSVDNLKINRLWQSAGIPDKRIQLWQENPGTLRSIGGYTLVSNKISDNAIPPSGSYTAVYEKIILFDKLDSSDTYDIFKITVTEIFNSDGTVISDRIIDRFIIEAIGTN